MPQLLEPGKRYAVCLDSDKDKPTETQPVFWAACQSARQSIEIQETIKQAIEDQKSDTQVIDQLKTLVLDWSNMIDPETNKAIPFDADRLPDILTTAECFELFTKITHNNHLNHEEKKSSESPV